MNSTQIIIGAGFVFGLASLTLSVLRTIYTYNLSTKLGGLIITGITDEQPQKPMIQQQQPIQYQQPVQQQYAPQQQQIQPQPVVPKIPKQAVGKQDFAQRIKDMNEGKKRARLARELAAKQAEMDKMTPQL